MAEDDKTPARTPSALQRLGLETCPACDRRGETTTGVTCFFCDGAKVVTHEKVEEWRKAHPPVPHDSDCGCFDCQSGRGASNL